MRIGLLIAAVFTALFLAINSIDIVEAPDNVASEETHKEISGIIKEGDTFFGIFKRYGLNALELLKLREASAEVHKLRKAQTGRPYRILVDDNNQIRSFIYWIDDESLLNITRTGAGFCAQKMPIEYEKRVQSLGGVIKDNLIASIGDDKEGLALAFQFSDIFAWDIDFTSDLREGDVFKVAVEGLYLDGEFKKYGNILSAEFINDGKVYRAYRFEHNGKADYYDADGKAFRKAFLKAPLNFRRVSSNFSMNRFHPVLKIYRPHHGLDYAAPAGTPVSAIGDGMVVFAGYKGGYGKLITIRHSNGYKTSYGHLSRIEKGIRNGSKVNQGDIIGYVGSTGIATGPHLHYEVRINNKPVNPLTVKLQQGKSISSKLMAEFKRLRSQMDSQLASIAPSAYASAVKQPPMIN
ncbi:MAG: peptidoglycan DD-metalloendopeptidase family protein [Nitrospirae bacterium]|nr:peptidoglycan DD-metalloendopeptidase family protein [Nitrospirota bacterium]